MRTKIFAFVITLFISGSFCFSQTGHGPKRPPSLEERLKMINEGICTPLNLDKSQIEKVTSAFKDFFMELDKLVDKSSNPTAHPEKSKVDPLAKIRDGKVKQAIPDALYPKYLELEMATHAKVKITA